MDKDFYYVEEFKRLDYYALKSELKDMMTTSQDLYLPILDTIADS